MNLVCIRPYRAEQLGRGLISFSLRCRELDAVLQYLFQHTSVLFDLIKMSLDGSLSEWYDDPFPSQATVRIRPSRQFANLRDIIVSAK